MRILIVVLMLVSGPAMAGKYSDRLLGITESEDAQTASENVAQPSNGKNHFFSGETFLKICESQKAFDVSGCWRYIAGTIDTLAVVEAMSDGLIKRPCVPDLATNPEIADRVRGYLLLHPEYREETAASIVFKALRDAWPCAD